MLAGTIEWLVRSLDITTCCCCVDHRSGVGFLGVAFVVVMILFLALSIAWAVGVR